MTPVARSRTKNKNGWSAWKLFAGSSRPFAFAPTTPVAAAASVPSSFHVDPCLVDHLRDLERIGVCDAG